MRGTFIFVKSLGDDLLSKEKIIRKTEFRIVNFDIKNHQEKKDKKIPQKTSNRPLVNCKRCGKPKRWRWHHGWPQWIDNWLKVLGIVPEDCLNDDKDELCDDCHEEIERINRKFEAVRMFPCKSAMLEMRDRFLNGEEITDDYIIEKARSIESLPVMIEEQTFGREVVIQTEN